jgi:phage-related protein
MMTVFLSLPGKIAEQVVNGVQAASRIVDALKTLLINVAQGITDLVNALIGIVWDAITSVISILNVAILETASIIQSVVYFVKYLAVTLISFFMGSGLIALSAARLIGAI